MDLYDTYDDIMRKANDFTRSRWYRWGWVAIGVVLVGLLFWVGYRRRVRWARYEARIEVLRQQRDEAKLRAAAEEREEVSRLHEKKARRLDAQLEKLDAEVHGAKLDYREHLFKIERAKRWEDIRREYETLDD